ncbi:MAG: cell surface protein SprA [Bacteroidaceae bacterium]|nr:cell surface protein SprA [Bacteroidaceae bacterium]
MIKGKHLAAALLLLGSCICGGPSCLYAQGVQRTLPNPENITEEVTYDENDETFRIGYKLGDYYIDVPTVMTPNEYNNMMMQRSLQSFYRDKYTQEFNEQGDNKFDFTDMKFDLGPAEKIFGPGGVQVRTSGSAAIKFGYNRNKVDNPSLSVQNRTTGGFDFDEQINLNINARVGDKINMNLNYNTEATFDIDAKMIKLRYEGKEDEIIRLLEAGNISFPTNSSLIQGASSLFGIRSDLQFGKLNLQMVLSQKESTSSSVSSQGGQQINDFEIDASSYDENRHFFLAHFFRDNYDANMAMLPNIVSGVQITRIEVWVTNKRSNYDNPRNIVAFTDLGETGHISNGIWSAQGGPAPANGANDLYSRIINDYPAARDIDQVATSLGSFLEGSTDYEKISNARKLATSDYILNSELGYISLKSALASDEVLAVAFEYTYGGNSYQVGEFSSDKTDAKETLFVKLLKSNSNSPGSGTWDLMMKNIYTITQGNIQSAQFKLGIYYNSDSTGSRLTYIPEAGLKNTPLIRIMNLDRLDDKNNPHPNGQFDFIDRYTVQASNGRIIFPVVEPFGSHLRKVIDNDAVADKYVFQELYDSTRVVAKRIADKDKFMLIGQYSGTNSNVIQLGSINIPRGSVIVTAGGTTLIENSDYTVDYSMGTVTIINQSIIDAGTSVNVQLESNTEYSMQRKTMAGLNWKYDFTPNFQMGGTFMHLNEKPLTSKVTMGDEPLVNTMYGLNLNWRHESQAITNIINKLPFVNATQPSSINFKAEMAALQSSVSDKVQGSASYIDDFEAAESGISILQPSAWTLSAVPKGMKGYGKTGQVESGFNRALLNWFSIDPLFTRRNSPLTPAHIKTDLEQLSNHYVREVYERELYPNKESTSSESTTLQILNLAYYPNERGPYNLNPDLDADGHLPDPQSNWGGIMRRLTTTDFEAANIEYIEFWMLDPFIYNPAASGGDLYLNLGEVSEDVLLDGKKFFENGLPVDGDSAKWASTIWGKVPTGKSLVYAFDNNAADSRDRQDVGLNGLSSEEERTWPAYASYLSQIRAKVKPEVYQSIYEDPAADTYHYYRGADYDDARLSVMERYRKYNGTEGNSPNSAESGSRYDQSARSTPDVEDANGDYTMDEYEKFFQYRVSLRPGDLEIGRNYISDKREVKIKLRNGNTETVNWYCFRIPIGEYEKAEGGIRDFSSIRFMRMYLTGFNEEVHVRFGSLELMTSQWRNYEQPIYSATNRAPSISGKFSATSVNIEENGDRAPVNYVVPPGVTRILDPNQVQLVQDNEQAMSLKVIGLGAGEARGIYKKSSLDLRKYQRIQMFSHAEAVLPDDGTLRDGDVSVFIRFGSDYSGNYYEYEIPLVLTPAGHYSGTNENDRRMVWPDQNMLDIDFSILTQVKNNRNVQKNLGAITSASVYSEYDPNHPQNRITVVGNPSIGNVRAIMVGIRNNSMSAKNAEVWINELRLVGYESKGGMAALSTLGLRLSDVASVDLSGQMSTAGYGGLEQSVKDRKTDDYYRYSITTSTNVGRFLPEKSQISVPIYYSYTKEKTSPKYSPYDTDLLLDDVIESFPEGQARDSIRSISQDLKESRNFSISNAKVNISSDTPMPYDPANFSFSYSESVNDRSNSTIDYEHDDNWRASVDYSYSPGTEGWSPFAAIPIEARWFSLIKDTRIGLLPQSISFNAGLQRSYHELQERDLEGSEGIPVIFSQQFYMNRDFSVSWNPLQLLRLSFNAASRAEIEEPYTVVNKDLYPSEYEMWKDSVRMSLRSMGRPLDYNQSFNATYTVPLNKIPLTDWITADAGFNSGYTWNRGTTYANGANYGNIISNRRSITLNGRLNLLELYNKVNYLHRLNNRYSSTGRSINTSANRSKRYQQEMTLIPGQRNVIVHSLGTLNPMITATTKEGKTIKLKFRKLGADSLLIKTKDTLDVVIRVSQDPDLPVRSKRFNLREGMDVGLRTLMMVRNVSVSYRNDYSMSLPGFMPNSQLFGQNNATGLMAPGLDFAFGMTGDNYLYKAMDNGWLLSGDSIAHTANSNLTEDLQIKMSIEPFRDIKIDANASWSKSGNNRIQYMYAGMPTSRGGNFSMTTITIGSAFERHSSKGNYRSRSFDRLTKALPVMRDRIESQYEGARYPDRSSLAGQAYDPANGAVDMYSSDVLIPAFLAAYTGRDAKKASLDLFPNVLSILPNWSFTYSGLSKLPFFKKYFKSFNLTHAYKSVYSVGNFNTFNSYMEYMNGRGFIEDVTSGMPVPSTMFNISSVSINETFAPLCGVNMTFHNDISARLEFRKTRVLTLSTTAVQVVETTSDDITAGAGYKITGVKLFGAQPGTGRAKVSNDLNMNLDFSLRNQNALCRNLREETTQATSGNRAVKLSFTADYTYSRMLTLNFYYDFQSNFPLVSTSAYPTSTHDAGFTLKFTLTR